MSETPAQPDGISAAHAFVIERERALPPVSRAAGMALTKVMASEG
ncbi:hypothetical protein [Bradyrhizobium archetypum]|nr:hypothetical protein [Bradyrhizobium archetypum]